MRESITQQDGMGCGVACVAFILGISYNESLELLGKNKAKHSGYRIKELSNVLGGYKARHVNRVGKDEVYKNGTIVFIKRSKRYPYGHYIVRHHNLWMDPWINLNSDKNILKARSGFRSRLPGKVQWVIWKV